MEYFIRTTEASFCLLFMSFIQYAHLRSIKLLQRFEMIQVSRLYIINRW